MAENIYWADNYVEKIHTGERAINRIKNGQRIFIGSSCGEPQHLVKELADASIKFTDLETLIADKTKDQSFNIRSFYLGSAKTKSLSKNMRFITPMNLSAIPRLFKSKLLPIHVALIQVSPPDDFGWMSLGISVDVTLAAAMSADLVIAQINSRMPRVLGRSFIHVADVDVVVEHEEALLTVGELPESEPANQIGQLIARLVDDGSTIQISPGTTPQATLLAFSKKKRALTREN